MPRLVAGSLTRVCLRLFEKDYQEIQRFATPDRPANAIIRDIVHQYLIHAGAALREKIDQIEERT